VTTNLHLDPELADVVERARRQATESGELPASIDLGLETSMTASTRTILAEWLRDGGYDAALAEIVADEPDLANQ
jgi:hypothetical protein